MAAQPERATLQRTGSGVDVPTQSVVRRRARPTVAPEDGTISAALCPVAVCEDEQARRRNPAPTCVFVVFGRVPGLQRRPDDIYEPAYASVIQRHGYDAVRRLVNRMALTETKPARDELPGEPELRATSLDLLPVVEEFAKRFLEKPAVIWLSESRRHVVARDDPTRPGAAAPSASRSVPLGCPCLEPVAGWAEESADHEPLPTTSSS